MNTKDAQLGLLPLPSKEHLKEAVARIAKRWPPYDKRYDEEAFFADIDSGRLTSEGQINEVFMTARQLCL